MMKAGSEGTKQNKTRQGTGGRLAAILLILIVLGLFWFAETDHPGVSQLRDRMLSSIGIGGDENSDDSADGTDSGGSEPGQPAASGQSGNIAGLDADNLPEYNGEHYVTVNGGIPDFPDELTAKGTDPYEFYGELDELGRCTVAYGCLGEETMPAQGTSRGDISAIHPSGWAKAQNWERCHLIAWALSDENANAGNLITGTHYLNYDGMRPIEEEVEHYIWNTGNHVLYLSEPVYSGDELIARGVHMAARSVEDKGKGISYNVYLFNVTPGAEINYYSGIVTTEEQAAQEPRTYVINTRSGVFHYPSCDGAQSIYKTNRKEVTATRKELTDQGYTPCGSCEP